MADAYLVFPSGDDVVDGAHDLQEQLPPGFRFHPTDEELVTCYLSKKASDGSFSAAPAVGEVDLGKCEPWDLPWKGAAATAGKKEWYFFSVRDRKYPAGVRTNRATGAGYWKATGKDKEIRRGRSLVGRKKTLVFYLGRAPKGDKTGWVMHEYRLDGDLQMSLCAPYQNEWVICRVFEKSFSGAAAAVADQGGLERRPIIMMGPQASMASGADYGTEEEEVVGKNVAFDFSDDPPPPSGHNNMTIGKMTGITAPAAAAAAAASHVTCFSNAPTRHGNSSFSSIFSASSSLISLPHWPHGRGYALNDGTSTAGDRKEIVLTGQEAGRPAGCDDLKLEGVYPPSSLLPSHESPGGKTKLPSSTAPSSDMLLGDLIWDVRFTEPR